MNHLHLLDCLKCITDPGPGGYKISWYMLAIILGDHQNPLLSDISDIQLPKKGGDGYGQAWRLIVRAMIREGSVTISPSKIEVISSYFLAKGLKAKEDQVEYILQGLYVNALFFLLREARSNRQLNRGSGFIYY